MSSTAAEKEKQKAHQENFREILSSLLKGDDNKYCVDCDAEGPKWASTNLGVFLCIRCAGIHRNMGTHISKVKSVTLDKWLPDEIAMMMEMGNSRARVAYEANLPDNYRRPQANGELESFIRAKYDQRKYMARELVPPKPVVQIEAIIDGKKKATWPPDTDNTCKIPRLDSSDSECKSQSLFDTQPPLQDNLEHDQRSNLTGGQDVTQQLKKGPT